MRIVAALAVVAAVGAAHAEPSPLPLASPFGQRQLSEPQPPVVWSFAAGLATGLVSMAVGGALLATDSRENRIAGSYVFMTGLSLAPAVSHMVSREWGRAAIFGSLPTMGLIGMTALLEDHPAVLDEGNKDQTRVVYVVLLAWGILSSAGGLVDSLWAGERARNRTRMSLVPTAGAGRVGLSLGGEW